MKTIKRFILEVLTAGAFSPTAFVVRAVLIAVVFCISELLGLREYTTFLSGTSANPNLSPDTSAMLGVVHLVLYVAFILIAPSCLLCAVFLKAASGIKGTRDRKHDSIDEHILVETSAAD